MTQQQALVNASPEAVIATGEERLLDFHAVLRVVALAKDGSVMSVDAATPRQITEKSQRLGTYELRPFGKQFQVITEIYRTAWTAVVDKNPAELQPTQVLPVFLRPMAVHAP